MFTTGEPIKGVVTAPDGTVLMGTPRHLIRVTPSTGAAVIVVPSTSLATWLLGPEEQQLFVSGHSSFEHASVLVTPDGSIWTHTRFFRNGANTVTAREWVLRFGADGSRNVIISERTSAPLMLVSAGSSDPSLVYSASLDAVVLSPLVLPQRLNGTGWWFGVASNQAPFHYFRVPLELVGGSTISGMVGSNAGTLETHRGELRSLRFDVALLDVDGDRLTRAQELLLGSSDFNRDSDGDGVDDHLELNFFHTELLDAGSHPNISSPSEHYAPSTKLNEWEFGADLTPRDTGSAFCQGFEPTGCNAVTCSSFKRYHCRGADGGYLSVDSIAGRPFFTSSGTSWWTLFDGGLATASQVAPQLVSHPYRDELASMTLGAASWGVVTQPRGAVRVSADGGVFAIYDRSRACELLGRPEDVCDAGPFSTPGIDTATAIGRDEASGLVFVEAPSQYARPVYAVTNEGATFVFDSLWLGDNTIGGLERARGEHYFTHTGRTLDLAFRASGRKHVMRASVAPWFRDGFQGVAPSLFRVPAEPPSRGCVSFKGILVCDSTSADTTTQPVLGIHSQSQWVPMSDDALQPGDVLFWANTTQNSALGTETESFALWRYTEAGGTEEWMAPADFHAVADVAAAATLDAHALSGLRQLAFSPSGTRLCFVDDQSRSWLMTLVAGRPTALTLERSAGARALSPPTIR